jgi:hypothetical protein
MRWSMPRASTLLAGSHEMALDGLRTMVLCHPTSASETKHIIGGKETLGGLERWFSPRGQDLAFLLSRIGLIRPRSVLI